MLTERTEFLGVWFDRLDLAAVVGQLTAARADAGYRYVVTPNTDHLVRLSEEPAGSPVRAAYCAADLCLCDSRVVALLAGLKGIDLPVVTGSDLTAMLFERIIAPGDRIAIVGGSTGMVNRLQGRFPGTTILHHEAPMGLRENAAARLAAARFVAEAKSRFVFIAVGSPQQELIAAGAAKLTASGIALCVGAALEFLTDDQQRAPALIRRARLEWAYRLASDPRRLWRRYLVEGPKIFCMAWHWKPAADSAAKPS